MKSPSLFDTLDFAHGPAMKNRLMLAPLTNTQSHPDGRLSEDEFRWLTMRAEGGFGLTMTCASHVQKVGQGFPGQLGVFSDDHLEGLTRLAGAIRAAGSVSSIQLHHAGNRSPAELVGQPVAPSDDPESGARGLSTGEVETLIEDFILAAERAEKAGFDGVEIHGAHGYILTQFLSTEYNRRDDRFGGSLENRARPMFEIIAGVRARCRPDFQVGLRLSPERFGLDLQEVRQVAQQAMVKGSIDYLDMSVWDVDKEPEDEAFRGRTLMSYFTDLERGAARLGVAGKVRTGTRALKAIEDGADFVSIGTAGILHHDFPRRVQENPDFEPVTPPVTRAYLESEGIGPAFIEYVKGRIPIADA
ncbi:NADH:flavin oxidoreductase [bacterium]|nr:MAG: NADH:flavin oxidoreductase [bacterium]